MSLKKQPRPKVRLNITHHNRLRLCCTSRNPEGEQGCSLRIQLFISERMIVFVSFFTDSLCFSFLSFIFIFFIFRELLGDIKLINGSNLVQGVPSATVHIKPVDISLIQTVQIIVNNWFLWMIAASIPPVLWFYILCRNRNNTLRSLCCFLLAALRLIPL